MTAFHITLESIYDTNLPTPDLKPSNPNLLDTYTPHSAGIYYHPANPLTLSPPEFPPAKRTLLTIPS
jgi:hypothetical protein